jgi:hypothetical protein
MVIAALPDMKVARIVRRRMECRIHVKVARIVRRIEKFTIGTVQKKPFFTLRGLAFLSFGIFTLYRRRGC